MAQTSKHSLDSTGGTGESHLSQSAAAAPKRKQTSHPYRGPFGYNPMSEWFWRILIFMMLLGVFVHMKRVIVGTNMWTNCTSRNHGRFSTQQAVWNHCFWNDAEGADGFWRMTHFAGGIVWMLLGAFQILTWNAARYDPTIMKIHKITGKIWWINAMTFVIGIGTAPSVRDWIINPTPHCTVAAIAGGIPANLLIVATRDYIGCPTYKFLPHFLTWAFTSASAVIMSILYSALDKSRREEHQAWGLTFAGLGCFDSINYTIKHVLLHFGFSAVDLAHYVLWWTPILFVLFLFSKTRLSDCHRWGDLIVFMLFGWPQILVALGINRLPIRSDFQERLKASQEYDEERGEKGPTVTDKRFLQALVVFLPVSFALYFKYFADPASSFVSEAYFKSH